MILLVWEVLSIIQDNNYLLPDVKSTFSALIEIIKSEEFFTTVLSSFLRVLFGLVLGVILGFILAIVCHASDIIRSLVSPVISIVKATPVASIIILLFIKFSGNELAVFIALLMVLPIIWQNVLDGFDGIDKGLAEVCTVYKFSYFKRLNYLVIPTLFKYLVPGLITSVGLAWKAEIATEIIAYTSNSIGKEINDAKNLLTDSPRVFAWTIIVIVLSILLEIGTKILLKRCKKWASE